MLGYKYRKLGRRLGPKTKLDNLTSTFFIGDYIWTYRAIKYKKNQIDSTKVSTYTGVL